MVKLPPCLFAAALASLVGCEETVEVDCSPFQGRYMELVPGRTWTFRVSDANQAAPRTKSQTVFPVEEVGGMYKAGVTAHRLVTEKAGGMVVSWQEDLGDRIVRHREQDMAGLNMTDEYYMDYRVRIDETPAHIVEGATWTESFTEIIIAEPAGTETRVDKTWTWTVEGVDVPTRVPAGDYCALRVNRVTTGGTGTGTDANKTYWFTRGVGKIKESADGDSQLEELVSFTE